MGYWIAAALLVVFGFLTGFSIGAPFLLLGLVMILVGPVRQRARIFWPVIVAVPAFTLGYVLVAPLTCTVGGGVGDPGTTSGPVTTSIPSTTTCTSVLGGPYAGSGIYNPPLEPALRIGLAAAGGAATVTFVLVSLARSRRASGR